MNVNRYIIRRASVEDAEVLAHQRTELWLAMKVLSADAAESMTNESVLYFREAVPDNSFIGWVIGLKNEPKKIVAGGGLSLRHTAPLPDKNGQTRPTSYTAHIFNVFVEPTHRKQGLARHIMQTIEQWCIENNVMMLTLNASDEGRPLYESLGYQQVNNFMRMNL